MTAADTLRRGFAILATLALALAIFAVPAHAAPAKGTAGVVALESFATDAVYAGTPDQAFEVTVTNASDLGNLLSPVNWIEVDPTSDFTVLSASGPGDWVAESRDSGRIIFTGDTLGSGGSVTFTLTTAVGRPDGDIALPWIVSASNDGGSTSTAYDPESAGALSPTIHVLQVLSNAFTGPELILDGDATEGQQVEGSTEIANLGSGTVEVTPSLSGSNFSPQGDLPTISLSPGTQDTVPWTVTLGDPGNAQVTADATGETAGWGPSDAPVAQSTPSLSVLDAADLSYLEDTLSPTIVGSATATTIDVTLDLENLGGVTVDPIDPSSQLSITVAGQTLTADQTSPSAIGPGETSKFTFSGLTVPLGLEGEASPVVTIGGTDQNGMSVTEEITLPDTIRFDPLAPTLELLVDLPTSMVNGEADAATSGTAFDIAGTVTDNGDGCGECDVTAELVEYDFAGAELARTAIPLTNDGNGNLSATVEHDFDADTVEAQVEGVAQDLANLSSNDSSEIFDVDLVAPTAGSAITGGPDGQDHRRIDITLDERTAFPQRLHQADFDVEGHTVTGVAFEDSAGVGSNDAAAQGNTDPIGDTIVLTLGEDLGEDETPVVSFSTSLINDEPYDRVGLTLGEFTIEAVDGIIPGLPILDTVGGLSEYDDPGDEYDAPRFFTNQNAPVVVVSDVQAGHRVTIYEDVDGDGEITPGTDTELGSAPAAQPGTLEIQLSGLGTNNRDVTLLSRATDGSSNPGLTAEDGLTIDTIVPEFGSVAIDDANREVQVTFSETLRDGRNAVADWVVEVQRFGRYFSLARDEVTGEYTSRTIHIAEDDSNWNGEIARLTYDFTGGEGERYFDRAGNQLGDFVNP